MSKSLASRFGQVTAISGAMRPVDALKRLNECLANEDPRGIFVISVSQDGRVDVRAYGEIQRGDMAWAGSQLVHEAHND